MQFILYRQSDGFIKCAEDHGETPFLNIEEIKRNNPGLEFVQISKDDYEMIHADLIQFRMDGQKITKKPKVEIDAIIKERDDWKKDNTISGLRDQVKDIKSRITK